MTRSFWYAAFFSILMMFAAAPANAAPMSDEWQAIITGQVEAFHAQDGNAALGFAGTGFKARFTDPSAFLQAIRDWGYAAIMDSHSHSFGAYQLIDQDHVLQLVDFLGPDQAIYQAVYQLVREPDGWRIAGVQMMKTGGMGA
jgi:hypothetical protein